MSYLIASISTLAAIVCWIGTILGFPGNWGIVVLAGCLAFFAHENQAIDIQSTSVITLVLVALVGEIGEFIAGAVGVGQMGGSKRGATLAVVGSIVGAIAGAMIGLPIFLIGSLVAAILFGCIGAFAGAVLGERWAGKDWEQSAQVGMGALFGKVMGTLLKVICGTAMLVVFLFAIWR